MPHAPRVAPDIALKQIRVSFGSTVALSSVDLHLTPGERHAVIGENGAGKSTLMRVLFGLVRPDQGEILVDGQLQRFRSPADALRLGIGVVQQHFELIPAFTVAENIVLGREGPRPFIDWHRILPAIQQLSEEIGLPINPAVRVADLSVASQQRVEILKALYRDARLLILDEPTAMLAPSEAKELWRAVSRLSQRGVTVVFVTHKLDDVMEHADMVTVLRRGERVLSVPAARTTSAELAVAMVGTDLVSPAAVSAPATAPGPVVLQLDSLRVRGIRGEMRVDGVTLQVRRGEIVALVGVDGSGQSELMEAIVGLRPACQGKILLSGREIQRDPVAARRGAGIGYIPEDRQRRAIILPFSCRDNVILGRHREAEFSRRGLLHNAAASRFLSQQVNAFDIRGVVAERPVRNLSGGNQQKLVLARELSRAPQVLLAAQPTRGLDFAATASVHRALRQERNRGGAILLSSLDLAEAISLCDRVAVMLRGRVVGVLDREEATEGRVGALMTGAVPE